MKRSTKIIISVLVVLAIVLAPVMFFFGNPLSYVLIPLRGNAYLAENYPELDVEISEVKYDFKVGGWSAVAVSPTSRDTWFPVYIDGWGNVEGDAYSLVLSGSTTAERIGQDYKELADPVLENVPLSVSISYADLTFMGGREYYSVLGPDAESVAYSMEKDYGLDMSTLVLDADYDTAALGAAHGRITIQVHDEEVTVERAAGVLLELKAYFDEAGLPFRGIHLDLCEPRNENGQNVGEQIELKDFLYEDIYEEGLVQRVQANWDEVQEHYARMDGTLKEEPVETTAPAAQDFSEYEALLDFAATPNWLARAIGCIFERPEEVDLYYMFYLGVEHPGSWDDISPESQQSLVVQGFIRDMDLQIMPVEKLEQALQTTFGLGLEDVTIPEGWGYIEAENAWCSNHSDAYFIGPYTITSVRDSGSTIEIAYTTDTYYYNTETDVFLDSAELVLTLNRLEDGTIRAVSNVIFVDPRYAAMSDRELIDAFSVEEAMETWVCSSNVFPFSEEGMTYLASLSPAFAEFISRDTALDTLRTYGPERIGQMKEDPKFAAYSIHLEGLWDYLRITTSPETTTPAVQDFSEYEALLDFSADPNWLARALGCTFERPEEIDLYYMFYLGVEHPGSWAEISEESRQSLIEQDFWPEFDLQIMPVEKLEEALQAALGIGLEDVTIPESWGYIEAENAYCSNHSDAFIPEDLIIEAVVESPDGTVELHYYLESYYNTSIDDFLYSVNMVLTLRETEDGFHAVSNVPVDLNEYDALYDRELIDIISTEEALADWAASGEGLEYLSDRSPAFAELMTRSSAKDTFAWYGPERIEALKTDPETAENAEHLALLIVSVRAP